MMDPPISRSLLKGIPHEVFHTMTLDMIGHNVPYHVLGYSWVDNVPVWTLLPMKLWGGVLKPAGDPVDIELEKMKEVNLRISGTPYCIGRFSDGDHIPCPFHETTSTFSQCQTCMSYDIPDPSCIFEPHCHIGTCGASFCQADHVVYLTGFRDKTKVGLTQLRRFQKRGHEQGADVILPLMVLGNRFSCRVMEWNISKLLGLPQSVMSNVKLAGWARAKDSKKISQRLLDMKGFVSQKWDEVLDQMGPDVKIVKVPMDLDQGPVVLDYPLVEPLPSPPKRYKQDIVRGEVVGYKGNYLVFRANGLWAWRIGESPGRVVYFSEKLD